MSTLSDWAKANPDLSAYGVQPVLTNSIADVAKRRGPLVAATYSLSHFAKLVLGMVLSTILGPLLMLLFLKVPVRYAVVSLGFLAPWLLIWLSGASLSEVFAWTVGVLGARHCLAYTAAVFQAFGPAKEG